MSGKKLRSDRARARARRRRNQRLVIIFVIVVIIGLVGASIFLNQSDDTVIGEGFVRTASGLQYQDLEVGIGEMAQAGDIVSVDYTGWLEDGTKFDSSIDRGEPFEFPLGAGRVIRGWDEGVAGMRVGGKRELRIPPDLGYGEAGFGATIPPDATLRFEVELLEIK